METTGERTLYFLGPKAGGTEIVHDGREILVITPHSPLGGQLAGRRAGDRWQLTMVGGRDQYRILSVV